MKGSYFSMCSVEINVSHEAIVLIIVKTLTVLTFSIVLIIVTILSNVKDFEKTENHGGFAIEMAIWNSLHLRGIYDSQKIRTIAV